MVLFVYIKLCIQFSKPRGLLRQFFLLRERLCHLDLCRCLLLSQGVQFVFCCGAAVGKIAQGVVQTDNVSVRV